MTMAPDSEGTCSVTEEDRTQRGSAGSLDHVLFESARAVSLGVLREWAPAQDDHRIATMLGQTATSDAEEACSEALARRPLACREGCDYCCHMRVVVTEVEAVALASYILGSLTKSELRTLSERITATAARTRGMTDEEWGAARVPCPLLVDGRCSAYAARPLECRGYNSEDAEACHRAYVDYLDWDVPMNRDYFSVHKQYQAGLLHATVAAGMGGRVLELTAALEIALCGDRTPTRWKCGEDVFADAELNATDPERRAFLPWTPSDELRRD